jgi:hypothetical protein
LEGIQARTSTGTEEVQEGREPVRCLGHDVNAFFLMVA